MNFLDRTFVLRLSQRLERFTDKGDDRYNFRCPICGDSAKSETKTRGWLYSFKNRAFYKCFNCEFSSTLSAFLKIFDSNLHREYIFNVFNKDEKSGEVIIDVPTYSHDISILSDLRQCSKVLSDHEAYYYLNIRMIPEKHWSAIFYCNDMNTLIKKVGHHKNLESHDLSNRGFVVVPFIEGDSVNYLMCRAIVNRGHFRYIMLKCNTEGRKIWGLNKLDPNKTIYITEGVFDAMFLTNSLAVGGLSIIKEADYVREKYPESEIVIVFDKDFCTNYYVMKQLRRAIKLGYKVFIPNAEFKHKDINEAILSGYSQRELIEYIKSRTYQTLKAELELSQNRLRFG